MAKSSRYSETMRIGAVTLIAALAAFASLASSAGAAPANFQQASNAGDVVFFTTGEQLVPGDTDNRQDVYERSYDSGIGDYVTREVSTGPTGGNDAYDAGFNRISADGEVVFFSTAEPLVPADTDVKHDVYARDLQLGTTELVSAGGAGCAGCGNGPADSTFVGSTPDGTVAFFVSSEALTGADTDSSFDIYARDLPGGPTTLVSAGDSGCAPACGNGAYDTALWGVSSNGAEAYFATAEQLSAADTDSSDDIYARDLTGGTTVLASAGNAACLPGCGNSGAVPVFRASSADGSRVVFFSDEALAPGDTDNATDVYARDLPDGPTTLVSAGSDENLTASFAGASADGAVVFFSTTEALVGADTNEANDVYRWSGGSPTLVTSGTCTQVTGCGSTYSASTADGDTLLFATAEQLDAADTDTSADIYEAKAPSWAPALVSVGDSGCAPACGNGSAPAILNDTSSDASKVFFTTTEQLDAADADTNADIYLRDLEAPSTSLSSPSGICPKVGGCNALFSGASADGAHLFFQTDERLTTEDVDSELDVYERSGGETRIVSTGNSAAIGPSTPALTGTDPASPGDSTSPRVQGQADLETSIKLYASGDCSGAPIATGTSLELGGAGIAVGVVAGSTTSFRATATDAEGDTSACSPAVTYTQVETPPPPPPAEEKGGGTGGGGGGKPGLPGSNGGGGGNGGTTYVTPLTRITFGPAFKTRKRRPVFRFTDATEQLGTEFFCKLDRKGWRRCRSPQKLRRVSRGRRHVFRVKARNAVGIWGPAPVKRAFKVVR